jgi:hypothetical protein
LDIGLNKEVHFTQRRKAQSIRKGQTSVISLSVGEATLVNPMPFQTSCASTGADGVNKIRCSSCETRKLIILIIIAVRLSASNRGMRPVSQGDYQDETVILTFTLPFKKRAG